MRKGSKMTPEQRKRISDACIGRKMSVETRLKLSFSAFGRKHSKKSIKKMSESAKKTYINGRIPWLLGRTVRKSVRRKISRTRIAKYRGCKKRIGPYWYVLQHDHPLCNNRGYIMEHRLVMEKHLGRYLTPSEVIHHINNDKLDNRIENLRLFPSHSEHMKYDNPKHKNI